MTKRKLISQDLLKDELQKIKNPAIVRVRAEFIDMDLAWIYEQRKWIESNDGKIVSGRMKKVKGEGRKLFYPNNSPLALRDDEFDVVRQFQEQSPIFSKH